jgi:hypothetical protein
VAVERLQAGSGFLTGSNTEHVSILVSVFGWLGRPRGGLDFHNLSQCAQSTFYTGGDARFKEACRSRAASDPWCTAGD